MIVLFHKPSKKYVAEATAAFYLTSYLALALFLENDYELPSLKTLHNFGLGELASSEKKDFDIIDLEIRETDRRPYETHT